MRHLLVVSHFFPPMGGGGVQRITKFVKSLEAHGWRATVVAGRPEDYWMRDETLAGEVPGSARVVRVAGASGIGVLRRVRPGGVGPRRSSRLFDGLRRAASWFLVPDTYIGWRPFALRAARAALEQDPADALLSTGPPETNHLVARTLRQATGLPWVADFRDPWFGLHLHPAPTPWHRAKHARFERAVLSEPDAVLATTAWLADLLRSRSPRAQRIELVRNGYDPADFAGEAPPPRSPDTPLRLVHAGMLTLTRSAEGLFRALEILRAERPDLDQAFEVELVGARESRNDALWSTLGLGEQVRFRDYVPHAEAVAAMRAADVLVLIKHVEPRFRGLIPGKLYEYMGAGRPILALVPESEAAEIVRELGWGEVVAPDDPRAIAAALLRLLEHKRAGRLESVYSRRGRERFERPEQARTLAALLDAVVTSRQRAVTGGST